MDILKRLRHENRQECMDVLTVAKETLLQHRRSQSSGTWASVAQEAAELNKKHGAPPMDHHGGNHHPILEGNDEEQAIEVSYDDDGDELVWI